MSNVYTTTQLAELMGVSGDTVRTWKKRNPDKLTEGSHWLKDQNNALMWTELGVQVLAQLQSGTEPPEGSGVEPPEGSEVQTELEPEPPDIPLLSRYEPLLDAIADAVAPRLQQQLDQKIMGKVQNFGKKAEPLTATECVSILQQLGLKPANPAALLTGSKVQALPQSN
ncbi:MAG: hypothetical protein WBB28_10740 [Crinalium sp.]